MNDNNYAIPFRDIPFLESDVVHIWSAYFPDNEEDIPYFESVLSEDERHKVNSFRFLKNQRHYVISRGILRCLLGKYLGQKPQDIEILYGLWGKPCLSEEQSLYFNLSHSRDYVLYAMSSSYEVGVDLEYIDPYLNLDTMASNILSSPQELEYWKTVNKEEKVKAFFKLWVCKEAFLKASGKGWLDRQHVLPLSVIAVLKRESKRNKLNQKMAPYFFESIPAYASALFIEGPSLRPFHYTWNSSMGKI